MSTFSIGKNGNQGSIVSLAYCRHIAKDAGSILNIHTQPVLLVLLSQKTSCAGLCQANARTRPIAQRERRPGHGTSRTRVKDNSDASIPYCMYSITVPWERDYATSQHEQSESL